ncbi:Golgi SNAP receptor complex member 1 [Coccinella septempunctata]|uniref:Golgi SNAP receptor complex member 1 n=1 Tax=Coccinella septempunctata TaxID=41139 RepID=UPI001D060C9C|nr:Golgi SNAP receptor complex member 1 [Coccinella septempunctata]XP_044763127.1 Golgi SNAP receptor complex member 1 [Coccinella septempunctata]
MANALTYDDLRKQARSLENEIDLKLVAFSKLGAGLKTPHSSHASDTVPLLSGEDTFETMSLEIEQLLKKLTQINEHMAEQPVSGAAMLHTIQRHRDILADLSKDYRKTNSQHESRREREDLLHRNSDNFRTEGINNRRDIYLKENQHIHNSDRLVNDQISIAMETRDHLQSQRQTFKRLQTRFNDMSNKYPLINSLIQRINLRKRRDSIILGLVVSLCTFLILLYIFH